MPELREERDEPELSDGRGPPEDPELREESELPEDDDPEEPDERDEPDLEEFVEDCPDGPLRPRTFAGSPPEEPEAPEPEDFEPEDFDVPALGPEPPDDFEERCAPWLTA